MEIVAKSDGKPLSARRERMPPTTTKTDAMEIVPRVLAENAGLDPINILIELRKAHKSGQRNAGVNVFTGKIVNMREENVIEPVRLGKQAIQSATEAASMILRIDDVIAGSGKSGPSMPPGMPPGGMGDMGDM